MVDEKLEKIIEFFNKIERPVKYILKTPYAGEKDISHLPELPIPPYAVIHEGKDVITDNKKYHELSEFNKQHNLEILCFNISNCNPLKGLIKELKQSNGYEIIYPEP